MILSLLGKLVISVGGVHLVTAAPLLAALSFGEASISRLRCIPVQAQTPCCSIGAVMSVQLPTGFSLLLLTQLFREGESISNQPYGMEFYLPW